MTISTVHDSTERTRYSVERRKAIISGFPWGRKSKKIKEIKVKSGTYDPLDTMSDTRLQSGDNFQQLHPQNSRSPTQVTRLVPPSFPFSSPLLLSFSWRWTHVLTYIIHTLHYTHIHTYKRSLSLPLHRQMVVSVTDKVSTTLQAREEKDVHRERGGEGQGVHILDAAYLWACSQAGRP